MTSNLKVRLSIECLEPASCAGRLHVWLPEGIALIAQALNLSLIIYFKILLTLVDDLLSLKRTHEPIVIRGRAAIAIQ